MHYFGDNFVTLGQNMDFNHLMNTDAPVLMQVTLKLASHYD